MRKLPFMTWQLFLYSALLVFGIGQHPQSIRSLSVKLVFIFASLLLFSLSYDRAVAASLFFAYVGMVFVQAGYFLRILIQAGR